MDEEKNPQEGFSYLQETIKKDKIHKKRVIKWIGIIAVLGVVFGVATSASFVATKPWIEDLFGVEEVVTIPSDQIEVEETPEISEDLMNEVKEEIKQELIEETEPDDLEITDFEKIYAQLYEVSQAVSKSTVTVQVNMTSEQEAEVVLGALEGVEVEVSKSVTGLIVASTSSEILILTPTSVLEDTDNICVKLNDGTELTTKIKSEYEILGYAIISVPSKDMEEGSYEVAELGNSLVVQQGDVAIALGNQFDYEDGLGYGVISSTKNTLNLVDGVYDLISTDIPVAVDGTGVLLNTSGQVIGLINTQLTDETAVDAIGISQLKPIIEALSNGEEVPYLGITGVAITEELSEQLTMPIGLYIQAVEIDSPAMDAGLRTGDIIVSMNDELVTSTSDYQNVLLNELQGDTINILIQRKGAEVYVEMELNVVVGSE